MPSQLPTTDTTNRMVKDFGIGTYDSPLQSEYNTEDEVEAKKSLPGVPDPKKEGDEIIGDSYAPTSDVKKLGAAGLPGDLDRDPRQKKRPEDSTIQTPIQSVAQAELPSDKDNAPAHSDYYDKTKIGETTLPGTAKNEDTLDKFLGSLGNWWSGWEMDDLAQPVAFPGTDRPPEETDKYTNVPTGIASERKPRDYAMKRQATNLDLVGTLTSDFLKKNGKEGLTRRHVMAFLSEGGFHQYLASDIVRCLQQRHNVHIADVLDQFPVSNKVASSDLRTATISRLVDLRSRIASMATTNQNASNSLKKCGDDIMQTVVELVRGLEDG